MRIITLAALAALGIFAIDTLTRARRSAAPRKPGLTAGAAAGEADGWPASGRLDAPALPDSPNAAERLQARHRGGALGDAAASGLGLAAPAASEVEYARSPGLADFARGA
jgi:hypothetical protein